MFTPGIHFKSRWASIGPNIRSMCCVMSEKKVMYRRSSNRDSAATLPRHRKDERTERFCEG